MSDANTPGTAANPLTIPLAVFYVPGTGYKIGIEASLNADPSSKSDAPIFQYYEFDTGASGFFAGYDKSWWPSSVVPTAPSSSAPPSDDYVTIKYSSGKSYTAQIFDTPVSFTQDGSTACLTLTANVGCIVTTNIPDWQTDITSGKAPLYQHFYGDFGTSIGPGNNSLMSILAQVPGTNGFIIDVGPFPVQPTGQEPAAGIARTGSLTIGITDDEMKACTMLVPMQKTAPPPTVTSFPGSGLPVYAERLVSGSMTIDSMVTPIGPNRKPIDTSFCFDTGAPSTEIHYGMDIVTIPEGKVAFKSDLTPAILSSVTDKAGNTLLPGLDFELRAAGTDDTNGWVMRFPTGSTSGLDSVHASGVTAQADPAGYVNTGLEPFFRAKAVYNLAQGVVGFIPYPAVQPSDKAAG